MKSSTADGTRFELAIPFRESMFSKHRSPPNVINPSKTIEAGIEPAKTRSYNVIPMAFLRGWEPCKQDKIIEKQPFGTGTSTTPSLDTDRAGFEPAGGQNRLQEISNLSL